MSQTNSTKSRRKLRKLPRRVTRFLICRAADTFWIATANSRRILTAFPVQPRTARWVLKQFEPQGA